MSDQRRTVRVYCVVNSLGQVGVAVMRHEHRGPRRLDTRLMSMRQVKGLDSRPHGVDPDVWLAYAALHELVSAQLLGATGDVTGH